MITRREEDYLEAIYNFIKEKGYARTTHIAVELDVKPASVTEMFQKLDSKGYINYRKSEGAVLTKVGFKIGEAVRGRHEALLSLLKVLDVPHETADKDACNMEHNLHPITIVQLKKFVSFVEDCPKGVPDWLACFRKYSRTGKFPDECKS